MTDWEGRAETARPGSREWVREMVTLGRHSAPSQRIFSRHHQNPHLSSRLGSLLYEKQPEEAAHVVDGETEARIAAWTCPEGVAGAVTPDPWLPGPSSCLQEEAGLGPGEGSSKLFPRTLSPPG